MAGPTDASRAKPTVHFDERMSAADALMWSIESDPQLRSTITSVWILDREPDWQRFRRKLDRCTREIPRLRQRAVEDPFGLAPPRWEIDPHFDLDFHVRRVAVGGDRSLRALLDLAEPLGMQAFDRDRPLWELHLVEGLEGGRVGMILKLHHAISDGVGLVRMTEGMVERSREAQADEHEPLPAAPAAGGDSEVERLLSAVGHRVRSRLDRSGRAANALGAGLGRLLREPRASLRAVTEAAASVARLLAPVSEPMSPLLRGRSLSVRFEGLTLPLDDLKRAAKANGGTLNDVFVGAVTGALRRYHEQLGAPVEELRMNMPINVRDGEKGRNAGNQFAPARFAVPVGIADPGRRMREIHERVAAQRAEPALPLLDEISAAIGALPGSNPARLAGAMMKAIDFTTSNVPGPRFPVYASGARIEHMFGFGPLAGAAANVTCFSYDGKVAIALNSDPAAVSDPALFAECLRKGFDEVLAVA